jgi:sec-independent protein translocase protein TatA
MLGLDNPTHIAVLLVVLLVVFGAKRLPEMGKSLGSGIREFKHSVTGASEPTALGAGAATSPLEPPTAEPAVSTKGQHADTPAA